MDFVRLGERYTATYIPDVLIEGYTSVIWTERFQEFGEFELKTFDVDRIADLLPEDTLVSHLETKHVMRVETHDIQMVGEGADAQPELTIRGRSATSVFENRWVEGPYQKTRKMRRAYSAIGAAAVLMWNVVDNPSGSDVTRGDDDPDTEGVVNDYSWNTKDVLPNTSVTDSGNQTGSRWWKVKEGILWPQLLDILIDDDMGLRCLRPIAPNPATVIKVKTGLAERGTIERVDNANVQALRFDLYHGIDRSATVSFSMLQGHLENPIYLNSYRDYKTGLEVMSGEVTVGDIYRSGDSGLTGWQRKIAEYDAGAPEIPPEPERPEDFGKNASAAEKAQYREDVDAWKIKHGKWKNKRDSLVADFKAESEKEALRALKKRRKINMFSGDIAELSPYKYKTHYDLGDTVMLYGDYGKSAKMVVSEYVHTADANGDRGFPGLVAP